MLPLGERDGVTVLLVPPVLTLGVPITYLRYRHSYYRHLYYRHLIIVTFTLLLHI